MSYLASAETALGDKLRETQPYGSMNSGFWYDWADVRTLLEEAGRKVTAE